MLHAVRVAAERVDKLARGGEPDPTSDPTPSPSPTSAALPPPSSSPAPAAADDAAQSVAKRRRTLPPDLREAWAALGARAAAVERMLSPRSPAPPSNFTSSAPPPPPSSHPPVFAFVEGALVSALSSGDWLLLDEVNLAPAETLERLAGVLEARGFKGLGFPLVGWGHCPYFTSNPLRHV